MKKRSHFAGIFEKFFEIVDDNLQQKVDVVIGIGIDLTQDGKKASPYSRAVALKCLHLFRQGKANNILLSGGYSLNTLTEAEAMAQVISRKVPKRRLFPETGSHRTPGNAQECLKIMKKHKWTSAILVAQQWHARRVKATFRKMWKGKGIDIYVVKAHSSYGGGSQKRLDSFWRFFIWDSVSFLVSKWKGYC